MKLINLILLGMLLAPPSTREIIKIYLNDIALSDFPNQKAKSLEITVKDQTLEEAFENAYQLCFVYGVIPQSIMFEIIPHDREKFLRAWQLSQEMLKAL